MYPTKAVMISKRGALVIVLLVNFTLAVLDNRDASTVFVDLAVKRGPPQHLASGFIYGIPDTYGQIPSSYFTGIGFRYGRAGGAQQGRPNRGWIWGQTEYQGRLRSTLSNYRTCRQYGADFIILPHDIWGTDQVNSSTVWPGDNGNWRDYEKFVHQLMSDLKLNNALEGLVWDIWNEADISIFWKRSQQQWLELWNRTYKILRANADFNAVRISGPSYTSPPSLATTWWTSWLSQIKGNNTIPDQYAYHLLVGPEAPNYDLQNAHFRTNSILTQYGLPERPVNINEYASPAEQIPGGAAWWISRLERYNTLGLRANWENGNKLHDLMANLLTKSNPDNYAAADYRPAPEYTVYQYYGTDMTGLRVNTTGSANLKFDVYATVRSGDKVRILGGPRLATGNWAVNVQNLQSVGLPPSGSISVRTMSFSGQGKYTARSLPDDLGSKLYNYSGNNFVIPVEQRTNWTAYAFEFSCGIF